MTRLPAGRSSTSMPGSRPRLVLGLGQPQPALAAGEEASRRPRRSAAATAANVSAKRRSTVSVSSRRSFSSSSRLRSRSARCDGELVEPLLLGLVLLLRERVHLAELLAAALEPLERVGELVAVVALGGLGARGLEPAPRLVALGLDARELDVDRRQPLGGGGRRAPRSSTSSAPSRRSSAPSSAVRAASASTAPAQRCLEPRRRRPRAPRAAAAALPASRSSSNESS